MYIPWDVWLASPTVRVLRGLYWLDSWVTSEELLDYLGMTYDSPDRNKYHQCIRRLVKDGQILRTTAVSWHTDLRSTYTPFHYRLAKRRKLQYPKVRL